MIFLTIGSWIIPDSRHNHMFCYIMIHFYHVIVEINIKFFRIIYFFDITRFVLIVLFIFYIIINILIIFSKHDIIQWHVKVLNTVQIVEFFKYYMIDDCQTWSEYSNITEIFTDKMLIYKKDCFFINSEIFKITLRKNFGHIQFFINFYVISLWYCIQVALIMFHDGMQLLSQAKLTT